MLEAENALLAARIFGMLYRVVDSDADPDWRLCVDKALEYYEQAFRHSGDAAILHEGSEFLRSIGLEAEANTFLPADLA